MSKVHPAPLPSGALLEKYARRPEAYTDCFAIACVLPVTFEAYVEAFYTTWLFKSERVILELVLGLRSTDTQAGEFARGERDTFAAWRVEARADGQILLDAGSTRSWLMLGATTHAADVQMLYFGSAVVATRNGRLAWPYQALLGFHTLYSRLLLAAAARRLSKHR